MIIEEKKAMPRLRTHPGEVLAEEYLKPLGLSARALGEAIGVAAKSCERNRARTTRYVGRHGNPAWPLFRR